MSIPRTVAEVLRKHGTLEVEGIDRMYLNVYVPARQRAGGVASFFRFHRGHQFASSALMDPVTKAFIAQMGSSPNKRKCLSCCSTRASANPLYMGFGENPGIWHRASTPQAPTKSNALERFLRR